MSHEHLHKPCPECGGKVHARAARCKCGAPSPWKEPEVEQDQKEEVNVYRVDRDFVHIVNGTSVYFWAGEYVDDIRLIGILLSANSPIVPADEYKQTVKCPCCGNVFKP